MLLSIAITFHIGVRSLKTLAYISTSLSFRSSHFPIAFALTEILIKSQTFTALATTPTVVSPVSSSGSSLHGVVLPAEEEEQQQEGSAAALLVYAYACACASSDGGVKLPSFERHADIQGQATGERSSQPFLGTADETSCVYTFARDI
ncbi:hypothetical protein ABZP36_008239 [Zizania latifolia]